MATSGYEFIYAGPTEGVVIAPPAAPSIAILSEDNRTPLVTIHPSGTLEYGPNYQPDEAAHRFWSALQRLMPGRCEHCGHVPGHQAG